MQLTCLPLNLQKYFGRAVKPRRTPASVRNEEKSSGSACRVATVNFSWSPFRRCAFISLEDGASTRCAAKSAGSTTTSKVPSPNSDISCPILATMISRRTRRCTASTFRWPWEAASCPQALSDCSIAEYSNRSEACSGIQRSEDTT